MLSQLASGRNLRRKVSGLALPCMTTRPPPTSAELKGPRTFSRIRPEIFDLEPASGLKLGQTKTKIPGTVPTNRHTTIPNDSGTISRRSGT